MKGEWVAGCRHGQGISLYTNGNIFEGEWQDDKVMIMIIILIMIMIMILIMIMIMII